MGVGAAVTEKRPRSVSLVGGAVRGKSGQRRDNVGLNRPPCHGLFLTHVCL